MAGEAERLTQPLLRAFAGETLDPLPWWLMRQGGRYLPEYRAIREQAGDFIKLCLTPLLAAEVTLQPVRRLGIDAAILFSDILLVPRALGEPLSYDAAGPRSSGFPMPGGWARQRGECPRGCRSAADQVEPGPANSTIGDRTPLSLIHQPQQMAEIITRPENLA